LEELMKRTWMVALAMMAVLPGCDGGGGGGGSNAPTNVAPPAPAPTPVPAPTPAPVPNVSGSWDSEARRWHLRLEHRGDTITGALLGYRDVYYSNPEHSDLAIRGTVSSAGVVSFSCAAFAVSFEGRIESTSRMSGTLYDCGNGCRTYGDILVRTAP
jgi:hypothetical protein